MTAQVSSDGDPEVALTNASAHLEAAGHTVVAWIWLEQLLAAGGKTGDFYTAKRQAARYFFRYELPKTGPQLDLLASLDRTTIDMQTPGSDAPCGELQQAARVRLAPLSRAARSDSGVLRAQRLGSGPRATMGPTSDRRTPRHLRTAPRQTPRQEGLSRALRFITVRLVSVDPATSRGDRRCASVSPEVVSVCCPWRS